MDEQINDVIHGAAEKTRFAWTLRHLMKREGLTQAALASVLGLTSSAVSLWCTGKAYPEVSRVFQCVG